ncbi:MAG: hypothetical protein KA714_15010 [Limnoraphis sp. WC205]|nr:hypothetical protein [Limnoraphis sp. WC205]
MSIKPLNIQRCYLLENSVHSIFIGELLAVNLSLKKTIVKPFHLLRVKSEKDSNESSD